MATTPEAGAGDPSVLRQIERQNAALTARPQLSAPPSVSGTSITPTSNVSNNLRALAPIVSGSETLYPLSTTTTSSNAITITSSINNDAGDITTVYATGGRVTATAINQTINQFTAVDSGVSQIIAGNGIVVTSTGEDGKGVVTVSSGITFGNIVNVNLTGSNTNVLYGNGVFAPIAGGNGTYGNSNVVSLLAGFGSNTIVTTGNVTANYFNGVATDVVVESVNNNYSYHMAFVTGAGDTTLHMDADDNLQYNPSDGLMTVNRNDMQYLSVANSVLTSLVPFDSLPLDLGNATNPWQDLYLSNSTIYLGNATISANGNSIVVDSITVGGNVGTIGNIASINLDGSSSNVLYGNGVFAPVTGGNVSELVNGNNSLVLDGDGNVVFEGTPAGNAVNRGLVWDFGANSNGVNSTVVQNNGGLSVRAWTEDAGNYAAPVNIITNQDANTKQWIFDGNGNLTLPGNLIVPTGNIESDTISLAFSSAITGITTGNATVIVTLADPVFGDPFQGEVTISSVTGTTEANGVWGYQATDLNEFQLYTDATITTPVDGTTWTAYVSGGNAVGVSTYTDFTIQGGNVSISSNDNSWEFGADGNLTLPGNTFAVNYANGTPVSLSGGNTGNVTFDDNIVIGTGDEFGGGGLYLAPGNGSIANSAVQYLRVRGGDAPTHIHLDTGNNQFYDQYFGADGRYVKLEANGNVVINADDYLGNSATWTLDTTGNLTLAGGNSVIQSIANSSLDILNPNVSTMVLTPDANYNSQALVLDPTTTGHIHLRAPGANIDEPSANIFLGGEVSSFEVGEFNGAVPNLFIHSNNNTWMFDIDGNLTLPQLTTISDVSVIGTTLTVGAPPTVIVISGADFSAVNTTYTKTSAATPTWEPAGYNPATDPYIEFSGGEYGIFNPGFVQALYVNTGTLNKPLTQWSLNPPLGSVAPTAVYTYGASGPDWVFGADGKLTFPGTPRIDTDANNFEVQAAEAINFEANTVVNIYTDAGNNAYQWQFGDDGILTVPGNLVAVSASPAPSISGFSSVSALAFTNGNSNVTVNANSNLWNFDSTGNLTIPGTSGGFIKTASNASIGIAAVDNGTNNPAQLLSLNAGTGAATSIVSAYATNATIQTNAAGTINTWTFGNTGNLTLPANTFAINYANGTQVSLGGSNIANGNSNVSIATANGNVTISAVGNTTMTVTGTGANVTGTLTSTGKIGYASGSTVTQTTSRGNGVTINAIAGTIITTSAAMVANEIDTFSVINSSVDPNNDIVLAQIVSPNQGTYNCIANPAVIGGFSDGFYINIVNISGFTTADETITVRFMVIKAPNA